MLKKGTNEMVVPMEELCHGFETVKGFSYLGDKVNAGQGCQTAVMARAKVG